MHKKPLPYLALFQLLVTLYAKAATHNISSLEELKDLVDNPGTIIKPGDRVILADGTYHNGPGIFFRVHGAAGNPITVEAETVGGVTITGPGQVLFTRRSSHFVLKGFVFEGEKSVTLDKRSHNFHITRNTFRQQIPTNEERDYLIINANDVEIDHNLFDYKDSGGAMLDLGESEVDGQVVQNVWVHHNHFKDNVKNTDPSYGDVDTLTVGRSSLADSSGYNIIEYNLFENCDAGYEMISSKSSDNTYRYNTLINCRGNLTTRHGHRCLIYGNFFINTLGLRIWGVDHKIYSNYFEKGEGILIGDGQGSNRVKPKNVEVLFNTFKNCTPHYYQMTGDGTEGATNVTFANNIIDDDDGDAVIGDIWGNYTDGVWQGNIFNGVAKYGPVPSQGYTVDNPQLKFFTGVYHIVDTSPAIDAASGTYDLVYVDKNGQVRPSSTMDKDIGADEFSTETVLNLPLTPQEVGPFTNPILALLSQAKGTMQQEAEDYTDHFGTMIQASVDDGAGDQVAFINDGDWVSYAGIDFGPDPTARIPFYARVSSQNNGGEIEIRLGSLNSDPIGSITVDALGDWRYYTTVQTWLSGISGVHTVYLSFTGNNGFLFNLNWFGWSPPSDQPLAQWNMNTGEGRLVSDSSGNGYDGTFGGGSWEDMPDGGYALGLDGWDSTVSLPANLFDSVSSEVSIALWAYGGTNTPASNCVFLAEDDQGNRILSINLPGANRAVNWDAGDSDGYNRVSRAANGFEIANVWNHWVFTKNVPAGTMKIYLNGALWQSRSGLSRPIGITSSARLGSGIEELYFDGLIDDVSVFNTELSSTKIFQLYRSKWRALNTDLPVTDGLLLHLDASKIAGIASGDPIDIWWNLANPGTGATAESDSAMPTFHPNALKGKAVARFDGGEEWLEIGDLRASEEPFDLFMVAQSGNTRHGSWQRILSAFDGSGSDLSAPNWSIARPRNQNGRPEAFDPTIFTRSSSSGLHLQGLSLANGGGGTNQEYGGDIAEVIVYGRLLSDRERSEIGYYLAHKYDFDIDTYVDTATDSDGDGWSDLEEMTAGTRPDDPNDYFTVQPTNIGGQLGIEWSSVYGREYVIKRSFDLINWEDYQTFFGDDLDQLFTDPEDDIPAAFYRMEVSHPRDAQ